MDSVNHLAEFSVKLLQHTYNDRDTLVSPVSLLAVLQKARSGAGGLTREELDRVIGADPETTDKALSGIFSDGALSGNTLQSANALWLRDDGAVRFREDFIASDVYKAPFDKNTVRVVNDWAAQKTNGEISRVLDHLDADTRMLLINALFFCSRWEKCYDGKDVQDHIFTTEAGATQSGYFMKATEQQYLIDNTARGFLKPYRGGRFSFGALLPDKGVSLKEYISGLTGKGLLETLQNPRNCRVDTLLPKFEVDQKLDLKCPLTAMGIRSAFHRETADFSGIGIAKDPMYKLFAADIQQFNKLRLNERGTLATSITMMGFATLSMPPRQRPALYKVHLDRPFLYMIIDNQTGLPLFLGTIDRL